MLRIVQGIVSFVASLFFVGALQAAPILIVQNGILTGARNVDVGGGRYHVRFEPGDCIDIFPGCDASEAAQFTFTTQAGAVAASQALLNQVLVGVFDTDHHLTNGCFSLTWPTCMVSTPYGVHAIPFVLGGNGDAVVDVVVAFNNSSLAADEVLAVPGFYYNLDNVQELATWAVWQRIPAPSTLACLIIGCLAMVISNRRRKAS